MFKFIFVLVSTFGGHHAMAPAQQAVTVSYSDGYCGQTSAYEASVNHLVVFSPQECVGGVLRPYGTAWIYDLGAQNYTPPQRARTHRWW